MDRKSVIHKPHALSLVRDPEAISTNKRDTFPLGSKEIPTMEENPLKQGSNEDGVQIKKSTKKNGDLKYEKGRKQNPNTQGNEGNSGSLEKRNKPEQ